MKNRVISLYRKLIAPHSYFIDWEGFQERVHEEHQDSAHDRNCISTACYLTGLKDLHDTELSYQNSLGLIQTDRLHASLVGFVLTDWSRSDTPPPHKLVHLAALDPKDSTYVYHRLEFNGEFLEERLDKVLQRKEKYEKSVYFDDTVAPYLFQTEVFYFRPQTHHVFTYK